MFLLPGIEQYQSFHSPRSFIEGHLSHSRSTCAGCTLGHGQTDWKMLVSKSLKKAEVSILSARTLFHEGDLLETSSLGS